MLRNQMSQWGVPKISQEKSTNNLTKCNIVNALIHKGFRDEVGLSQIFG